MSAIEATINLFRAALQRRCTTAFNELVEDLGVPTTLNTAMWQLQGAIDVSARLGQAYELLPLLSRPAGIEVAADDLRDALAGLKIDEAFGQAEAEEATARIDALNRELELLLREALVVSDHSWIAAAKAVTPPQNKGQAEAALAAKGFHGPLLEALLKADGSRRHDERVLYLKKAVPAAVKAALDEAGVDSNVYGLAGLIMHADAAGVGGHADIEGVGTARPALLSLLCGSGRKLAGDGPAWSSAISSAGYQEVPNFVAGGHVIYRPDTGELVEYNSFEAEVRVAYRCSSALAEQLIGPRYLRAAALRAATAPVMTDRQPQSFVLSAAFKWADEALKEERARASARTVLGW